MAKNTHLEHLEDDIINQGKQGGFNAINFLRELGKMLSEPASSVRLTTKWDGAPAIVCGIHPRWDVFFVGNKSVFNKALPKVCITPDDVDAYYPSSGLNAILKTCLEHLPKLGITGIVQGDLLFTNNKRSISINGKRLISFQPNTIVYTVPEDSNLGKVIDKAHMGIVFHTKYSGSDMSSLNATFGVDISNFNQTEDVYAATASFDDVSGAANFSTNEKLQYNLLVNKAEGSLKQASFFLSEVTEYGQGKFMLGMMFKQYMNRFIRSGMSISNAQSTSNGFVEFYEEQLDKEIESKKTKSTQDKYIKMKLDGLKFLQTNSRSLYFTVASYMNLIEAKTFVIRKLELVKTLGTFLRTDNGYEVTAPEGFVAIKSGNALKLVDRLEFSRANFTAAKDWENG